MPKRPIDKLNAALGRLNRAHEAALAEVYKYLRAEVRGYSKAHPKRCVELCISGRNAYLHVETRGKVARESYGSNYEVQADFSCVPTFLENLYDLEDYDLDILGMDYLLKCRAGKVLEEVRS